ncbi:hypothetical protein ACFSUD_08525 [Sulfitobacter aestuarii]|uniref:Hedgehog/Intein (Hint) domain-containing protein n=1 Tax=Sulfitobacter aestuarii TaxID=2161676 RepID=A0ABW5U1Y4_9RHOB
MPLIDRFQHYSTGLTGPICGGFAITPDDAIDVASVTRAIILGTGGDVALRLRDGDELTLLNLAPGVIYPLRVSRVLASGTTATGITGLL